MIRFETVPTRILSQSTRLAMSEGQSKLTAAQAEVTTSRHADQGLALGHATASSLSMRMELEGIDNALGRAGQAMTRASITQATLSSITALSQDFFTAVSGASQTGNGGSLAQQAAATALGGLRDLLSATHDGQYLFGGLNDASAAIYPYEGRPRTTAIEAFTTEFGFPPTDPAAYTLTPAQVSAFLDDEFEALFTDPAWSTNWSSASDEPTVFRLDSNQGFGLSTDANKPFIKALAKAFTMMEMLGGGTANSQVFEMAAERAMNLVLQAQSEIGAEQARIAMSEQRLNMAMEALQTRKNNLSSAVAELEGVDPYEAATRVNLLMTQLETSYALTGRISRLSLLSYI